MFCFVYATGSSNGHSPVLNLSKTAGSGSVGEHSGSEGAASHRSQDDEEEDDNLSDDLDDDNEKDEGASNSFSSKNDFLSKKNKDKRRTAMVSLARRTRHSGK